MRSAREEGAGRLRCRPRGLRGLGLLPMALERDWEQDQARTARAVQSRLIMTKNNVTPLDASRSLPD